MPNLEELTEDIPTAKRLLGYYLASREEMARIVGQLKKMWPAFPDKSQSLFIHYLLYVTGMPIPYAPALYLLEMNMLQAGWRPIPNSVKPCVGDIVVLGEDDGPPTSMAFVVGAEAFDRGHLWVHHAASALAGRPAKLEVLQHPIRYYLRIGEFG